MKDFQFPTPPDPSVVPFYRRIPSVYYWWFGAVILLGLTIIWLPTQCTLENLNLPSQNAEEVTNLQKLNQDEDLEFRQDGLWYAIGLEDPFTGVAEAFHANGEVRSRTKIKDGVAYGLIEEWDENGTSVGPRFKDDTFQ